jgi:hypothetical protein
MGPATITLVSNSELDALTLRQADPWLLTTDDAADTLGIVRQNQLHNQLTKRWLRGWRTRCQQRL